MTLLVPRCWISTLQEPWGCFKLPTAAAAAKSLQSWPTLCDPVDGSPPGSPVPGILQARILEWVAISFSSAYKWKVKVKSLIHVWLLQPTRLLRPWDLPGKSTGVKLPSLWQFVSAALKLMQLLRGHLLLKPSWPKPTHRPHLHVCILAHTYAEQKLLFPHSSQALENQLRPSP